MRHIALALALFVAPLSVGCGDDGATVDRTPLVAADCADLPDTSGYIVQGAPVTTIDDCDNTLAASGTDDHIALLTAIAEASPGDTICLSAGAYDMGVTIDITDKPGLTLKGIGASPDDTVLDWMERGSKGINVTVDNVTVENMWVKNTAENGVEQKGTSGAVFRKLMVSWDGTPRTENGAYGIYPVDCENGTVEYCQTQGASDAGIYIGRCNGGTVTNNVAYENVLGIEVENCDGVTMSNNQMFGNTAGLLCLQQDISATNLTNTNIALFDNVTYCNNLASFAKPGSAASVSPAGVGFLIYGSDGVEAARNDISSNKSIGIAIVSNALICEATGSDCGGDKDDMDNPVYRAGYNPYAQNIYLHDNRFANNATMPEGDIGLAFVVIAGAVPIGDVVWDGYAPDGVTDSGICLGTDPVAQGVTFRDLTSNMCKNSEDTGAFIACGTANTNTNVTDFACAP